METSLDSWKRQHLWRVSLIGKAEVLKTSVTWWAYYGFESHALRHLIEISVFVRALRAKMSCNWLSRRAVQQTKVFPYEAILISILYWGIAKSVRHRTLTPAFAGSSPATPAIWLIMTAGKTATICRCVGIGIQNGLYQKVIFSKRFNKRYLNLPFNLI